MKRRDFETVAAGIRAGGTSREERRRIAIAVADKIEGGRLNSNFNRARFVSAATGFPETKVDS